MADETTQPTKQVLSGKERFENRQAGKKRALENNPEAMVFVPESPIARMLMNSIMTTDAVDNIMRSEVFVSITEEEFKEYGKTFQELLKAMEKANTEALSIIAKNSKIELRSIRNRFLRKNIEDLRKEAKKTVATEAVAVETKKVEVEAPKK